MIHGKRCETNKDEACRPAMENPTHRQVDSLADSQDPSPTTSTFSQTTGGAITATSRPLLPLGDFLQNTCRLLETVLSAVAPGEQAEGFMAAGGGERLLKLLNLPNLPPEVATSSIPPAISNILRFVLVCPLQ